MRQPPAPLHTPKHAKVYNYAYTAAVIGGPCFTGGCRILSVKTVGIIAARITSTSTRKAARARSRFGTAASAAALAFAAAARAAAVSLALATTTIARTGAALATAAARARPFRPARNPIMIAHVAAAIGRGRLWLNCARSQPRDVNEE